MLYSSWIVLYLGPILKSDMIALAHLLDSSKDNGPKTIEPLMPAAFLLRGK